MTAFPEKKNMFLEALQLRSTGTNSGVYSQHQHLQNIVVRKTLLSDGDTPLYSQCPGSPQLFVSQESKGGIDICHGQSGRHRTFLSDSTLSFEILKLEKSRSVNFMKLIKSPLSDDSCKENNLLVSLEMDRIPIKPQVDYSLKSPNLHLNGVTKISDKLAVADDGDVDDCDADSCASDTASNKTSIRRRLSKLFMVDVTSELGHTLRRRVSEKLSTVHRHRVDYVDIVDVNSSTAVSYDRFCGENMVNVDEDIRRTRSANGCNFGGDYSIVFHSAKRPPDETDHEYHFTKRQRLEFCDRVELALKLRIQQRRHSVKPCSVSVDRLSWHDINFLRAKLQHPSGSYIPKLTQLKPCAIRLEPLEPDMCRTESEVQTHCLKPCFVRLSKLSDHIVSQLIERCQSVATMLMPGVCHNNEKCRFSFDSSVLHNFQCSVSLPTLPPHFTIDRDITDSLKSSSVGHHSMASSFSETTSVKRRAEVTRVVNNGHNSASSAVLSLPRCDTFSACSRPCSMSLLPLSLACDHGQCSTNCPASPGRKPPMSPEQSLVSLVSLRDDIASRN